jgi:phosphoribosylformylglycinamidine synthase
VLEALLGHPNIGSRAWVTTQYDQTVGADTVAGCEQAAGVLRVKGTKRAIVVATDSQPNVALHDPALAASLAVAESARNIAVTGARPLGITNCLNFGDPSVPEAYWQLAESVRGMKDAAIALNVPITGGNVSLYNESPLGRIAPTAQIGIVGVLDDIDDLVGPAFKHEADLVVLLGETGAGLVGSAYERLAGAAPDDRPPSLELTKEAALHETLRGAARAHLLESAQDVSGGGLAVAIAESAIWGNLGADLNVQVALPPAVVLFGESPSRAIVTVNPDSWSELAKLASGNRVACRKLGTVGGDRLHIRLAGVGATGAAEERGAGVADQLDVHLSDMKRAWQGALPRVMGEDWH